MLAAITGADLAILDFIYDNLHCAFLDAVMPVITALGNGGILFIAIAVVMLFFKRTRKTGLMIGCALILGPVSYTHLDVYKRQQRILFLP